MLGQVEGSSWSVKFLRSRSAFQSRTAVAVVSIVAASGLALLAWNTAWSRIDVRIEGAYSTVALTPDQAEQMWQTLQPNSSGAIPPGNKTLVTANWNSQKRVHWPATDCQHIIFITHHREVSAIAIQGDNFSLGSSSAVDEAVQTFSDIPTQEHPDSGRSFEGSTFFVDSTQHRGESLSVLFAGDSATVNPSRVGVLFTCNGRLIHFAWLNASDRMTT